MRVLILTVGGSDAPIVSCIKNYRPDRVVFLCTEDEDGNKGSRAMVDGDAIISEGRECKICRYKDVEKRENIVKQCNLNAADYEIYAVPHDDPNKSYEIAFKLIKNSLGDGHDVTVDYTGGTKSMSVGLAVAAMEFPQCNLSVVKGKRQDLIRVRDGMERVSRLPSYTVFAQRQERLCRDLIREWNYTAAVQILEEMSRSGFVSNEKEFDRLLILCRGFAAWDKFDYQSAVEKISIYKEDPIIAGYNSTLKQICAALDWYEKWSPNNRKAPPVFVLVYDVLLNAERRACQGNYDDAVSRIYRAVEMYGQLCLRTGTPSLTSENIDVSLLPEQYSEHYEKKRASNGKIQIGLTDDYELLAILGHPVKQVWESRRERILNILNKRNYSFLAHGMETVSERDYLEVKETVWSFISDCDQAMKLQKGLAEYVQLPREL